MSLYVKICGITTAKSARAAVDAGADALGFVFADSPRQLAPMVAAEIASDLPGHVEKVAVFLDPAQDEIGRVLEVFNADRVQANASSLVGFGERPVMPVLRAAAEGYVGERVLFEGPRSGVGDVADWEAAASMARTSDLVLAGGLDAGNVATAVGQVRPFGVDVSSGVESRPGTKDQRLIEEFIKAVRKTEEANEVRR